MLKAVEHIEPIVSEPIRDTENYDPNNATVKFSGAQLEAADITAARKAAQDSSRKDFEAGKLDERKKKGLLGWGGKLGFLGGKRRTKRRRKKRLKTPTCKS